MCYYIEHCLFNHWQYLSVCCLNVDRRRLSVVSQTPSHLPERRAHVEWRVTIKAASTPTLQTLGEISPSSRADCCCIIIHWFLWMLSTPRRELGENSPRTRREKNHLQNVARACANSLAANISLKIAVGTCSFCWTRFCHIWESIVVYIIICKKMQTHSQISVDGQARRIWTNCQEKRNSHASSRREPV